MGIGAALSRTGRANRGAPFAFFAEYAYPACFVLERLLQAIPTWALFAWSGCRLFQRVFSLFFQQRKSCPALPPT
jgi:hypothetical protein